MPSSSYDPEKTKSVASLEAVNMYDQAVNEPSSSPSHMAPILEPRGTWPANPREVVATASVRKLMSCCEKTLNAKDRIDTAAPRHVTWLSANGSAVDQAVGEFRGKQSMSQHLQSFESPDQA